MKHIILFGIFLIINSLAYSQKKDPKKTIEANFNKCLAIDSNRTPNGFVNCRNKATIEWEKELEVYFKLLTSQLSDKEKLVLNDAQKQWMEFKKRELALSSLIYHKLENSIEETMIAVFISEKVYAINEKRALDLKIYYDLLVEHK